MSVMTIKTWLAGLCVLALVGCGGGGGGDAGGTPLLGNSTTTTPAKVAVKALVVTLSAPSISNAGSTTATVTVTAIDANNNAVASAPVTLSADANAIITVQGTAGSVTDASGKLIATVGIGSDRSNRDITLTATAGSATGAAVLKVVDATSGTLPAMIDVIAGATTVGTGGDGVQISAFVKDANNNALAAVPVAFKASTGTLSGISAVTDASGLAKATIAAGSDRSNRSVKITVSAGPVSNQLTLPVTGTTLTLQGPTSMILGRTAAFDIVATDSKGNVVANVAITASSALGNGLAAPSGSLTNAAGLVRFSYAATNGGTDSLVFSGAGAAVSPQTPLVVSGLNFAFVSPPAATTVAVNTALTVRVQLLVSGGPPGATTISFATTGGTLSANSATTDAAGVAQVNVTSSSAGPLTVQASVDLNGTITSTSLPLVVAGIAPSTLVLQVSPTALPPNVGGATTNQAQVLAKVSDAVGNPVQGATVNFKRVSDPSGGNLQQVSAITDASGKASVTYVSGPQSTANNGVVLQASVASAPAVTGTASLTVNQAALFIALGTGNDISNLDPQTYKKDWSAYVTDSNGIAVNGVTLSIKALPTYYRTGQLVFDPLKFAYVYSSPIYSCRNEDANANGVLDTKSGRVTGITVDATTKVTAANSLVVGATVVLRGLTGADAALLNNIPKTIVSATPDSFVIQANTLLKDITATATSTFTSPEEDDNGDGVLWPGNVIAVTPSTVQTSNGLATISLVYAESFAPWVQLKLTATATVAGTESKTDAEFVVTGLATDFSLLNNPPAGLVSPFGLLPTAAALTRPGACVFVQ